MLIGGCVEMETYLTTEFLKDLLIEFWLNGETKVDGVCG